MTANLNFEAESFNGFGSHPETSLEYENVHDHRPGALVQDHRPTGSPAVRDHRAGGSAAAVRDHRFAGSAPSVRDHRFGGSVAPVHGRQGFASHVLHSPAFRDSTAFLRRAPGFGAAGIVRGSGLFHGVPTGFSWNRGVFGGRPYSNGARGRFGQGRYFGDRGAFRYGGQYGHDFHRRWPWLSRDWRHGWRDGATGVGLGYDGGYSGPGSSGPDYSGAGSSGPSGGPDYSGPDSSAPDYSGAGFASGAPTPGLGSPSASDDPQIVSWAQGCLAQIVGGWVPQDGKMGRLTSRAIEIFQNQSQIPSTGTLDDNTLSAIQQACHAINAGGGQATPPSPPPDANSAPPLNVAAPDATAGAPPTAPTSVGGPPPTSPATPPAPDPSAPAQQPELPYWSQEYQEYENGPQRRTCEPDRCTNAYLRWLQNSLNQVFGQRLAITGTLDDPTMAAINRFRLAKKLRVSESYHVGPAIEDALLAAGASQPPAVPPTQCAVSDPSKLIPILDRIRGDIPLEFLLGWIDVESGWVLEPPSTTCERGYFQLYPEDSVSLGLDHDRIGTDPAYSVQSGVPFINRARKQIERAVKAFGVPRNSDLYWRLVKLWHWIPSAPEKILAAMSAQGVRPTDWDTLRAFSRNNFDSLTRIIRRDPRDGTRSVDHMFTRVNAWRKRLHP